MGHGKRLIGGHRDGEKQSGLAERSSAPAGLRGGPDPRMERPGKKDFHGPNGPSHPHTGSQREHFKRQAPSEAHSFPGRRH